MGIRPERVNGHIGTEIRPRLLREAAAKNIDGATPRERRRPEGCKVLLKLKNKYCREWRYGDGRF